MIPACCNEKSYASAIVVSITIFLILFMMKILLIIEKGNGDGVSIISKPYKKANNPYMGEYHDPSKPTKLIHGLS